MKSLDRQLSVAPMMDWTDHMEKQALYRQPSPGWLWLLIGVLIGLGLGDLPIWP